MGHKNSDTSSSIWRKLWSADSRVVVAVVADVVVVVAATADADAVADVVVVVVIAAVDVVVAASAVVVAQKKLIIANGIFKFLSHRVKWNIILSILSLPNPRVHLHFVQQVIVLLSHD